MIPIISVILVIIFSVLVTKIAAIAMVHTGLSRETARFQARSAFTGVGFTTSEAEAVINHPVRRRIILLLMLFGNAGIVTVISSFILAFLPQEHSNPFGIKILVLFVGLGIIWFAVQSKVVDKYLFKVVSKALKKYTDLDVKDYSSLLHLSGAYRVTELYVEEDDWISNKTLMELKLSKEGVLVLGIKRKDGNYIGSPKANIVILPDDVIILYGRITSLEALDIRKKGEQGDMEHEIAVKEQKKVIEVEDKQE
ncbi:MAG: TrkA C-terminal domain-containing protein [Melioribacteraceae bacterium]|nr:TrkA C-terminal domain-containing protein [Melioribacteraceae bacterium]